MNRIPNAPAGLRPEAKKYWQIVNKHWVLDDDALEVLRAACFALSRQYEAQEITNKEGITYKIGSTLRQNPAFRVEIESRKQFLIAVKQLGLDVNEEKRLPGRPPGS